jgi:carbon-monoxide dehydrogenase medium subunit
LLLPEFTYLSPKTTDELALMLAKHQGKAKVLSGGTDIIPNMLGKLYKVEFLIDLGGVDALTGITYKAGIGLVIGAGTKMNAIERSTIVKEKYTALHKAASEVGSPQIRAMATLGGNSCNASPAADTPPSLVALGANVTLASRAGKREMSLEEFIEGNRITALKPDEYLEKFTLPEVPLWSASRFGLSTLRAAVEIDVANLAVYLELDEWDKVKTARIAMGSVAPVPLRAKETEKMLKGQIVDNDLIEGAAVKCSEEAKPIDDIRASAQYRKHLIKVLAKRTIKETLAAIA